VVLKEELGDIRESERVVNQKTQVPWKWRIWVRIYGWRDSGDPEIPGEILGSQKIIVLGFMDMFLWWYCLKMTNPGSDFGLEGLRRPGETRRDFGLLKNHFFRLHANVSMVKLPENDESEFIFWVGGTQETRRDPERFLAPKKPFF
jgi:hypothetical protein